MGLSLVTKIHLYCCFGTESLHALPDFAGLLLLLICLCSGLHNLMDCKISLSPFLLFTLFDKQEDTSKANVVTYVSATQKIVPGDSLVDTRKMISSRTDIKATLSSYFNLKLVISLNQLIQGCCQ